MTGRRPSGDLRHEAALQQHVEDACDIGRLPSVAAATFCDGMVDWMRHLGSSARQYRIGSITKTFTAVAVLRLRDEGRLSLSDPIGRHLSDAPYADHSIRALLSHSSGMTAEPAGPWWERSEGGSWEQLLAANAVERDVFAAGQRYHYSNLAFALLGELVARSRRCSWYEAISSELLTVLGLNHTTYHPQAQSATGTSRHPLTGQLVEEPAQDTGAMAPAGQLWSTVLDLARWANFLVTGDDRVLAASSLVEMRTIQSGDPSDQHIGAYGLGLRLRWHPGGSLVGHTGSMPGFVCGLFVDPSTSVGAVLLCNATTGVDVEGLVTTLVDEALAAAPQPIAAGTPAPHTPHLDALPLAGEWYWGNTAMTLDPTSGGFSLRTETAVRYFEHVEGDEFRGVDGYFAGETLTVWRDHDGAVTHLEVVSFIFTSTPYDPAVPVPGGPPRQLA